MYDPAMTTIGCPMLTEMRTAAGEDRGYFDQFSNCGVLRNHWDSDLLTQVRANFPLAIDPLWRRIDNRRERLMVGDDPRMWNKATVQLLSLMCGSEFRGLLTELTGIQDLIPDASSGGYLCLQRGDFQGLHVEPNKTPVGWRRLYVQVFLNPQRESTFGENLLVYENPEAFPDLSLPHPDALILSVAPQFNHTAVFETKPSTFYGTPDRRRGSINSVVVHYYTEAPPSEAVSRPQTVWWTG